MKKDSWFNKELKLEPKINLFALAFCGISACLWTFFLSKEYYMFGGGWDAALHAQTLWSLSHGSFQNSIFGANFLADHCFFLFFLMAPIYWLHPDPLLPQYFKIAAFFIGSYLFFLILKKRLNPWIALGAMVAFSVAPANVGMLQFSFNFEPFSIPLIFLIFKAFDDKNYGLYIGSCFLLAMVKEQLPLLVVMFGFFAFFSRKEDRFKWAAIPMLMGLLIFTFDVFILTPYIRKDLPIHQAYYWARYSQFGKTPQEIVFFLISHPLMLLKQCATPINSSWYNALFGIWGGLAFLSPQILLIALPLFIKTIFSNVGIEHMVNLFYYASTFTPFIYLATWNSLGQIQNKWRLYTQLLILAMMLIHAVIFLPYWFNMLERDAVERGDNIIVAQKFIDKIPAQASVLSSETTMAPLANRKHLYPFISYLTGEYTVSGLKFVLPEDTDYLLLDFADEYRSLSTINRPHAIPRITALNFNDHWKLQESIEDLALYVKNTPKIGKADRLIEIRRNPFLQEGVQRLRWGDDSISFQGFEFPRKFDRRYRIFPVTMYWKSLRKTESFYGIQLRITSSTGGLVYEKLRLIGSTIYPTYSWHKGEYVKERYFHLLPHLLPGKYFLDVKFYDLRTPNLAVSVREKESFDVTDTIK